MSAYEDLVEAPESQGDDYFDGEEFALRAAIEAEQYWHVHRREVLLQTLLRLELPPDMKLIELGCGIGTVATHLNLGGLHVDYGDVFGSALTLARERAKEALGDLVEERRFVRVDVTHPLPLRGYGGLLLFDVLEHLPDDRRVLEHLRDALPPDGLFMLTVPAFNFLWSPWDELEKHKRRYTRDELTSLLEASGFSVERATYFFLPLFFAASAVKGLRLARALLTQAKPPQNITEMAEARGGPLLNRLMLSVLAPERPLMNHLALPFGTSILVVARRR